MMFGRGWFGWGGMGYGRGFGRGMGMGRGRGFGMGYGRGMGMGRGNPYPFCRFNPSLPRRWWAYSGGYQPPAPMLGYGRDLSYANPTPYNPWW
jgi:hypothetical protein